MQYKKGILNDPYVKKLYEIISLFSIAVLVFFYLDDCVWIKQAINRKQDRWCITRYIEGNSPLSDLESFQRPDVVIAFRESSKGSE